MKHNHTLKGAVLSLTLALMATGAEAHDPIDCQLEAEVVCDEVATDPSDWEYCAWFVGMGCWDHSHQARPGNRFDKLLAQIQDREVQHKIELNVLKFQLKALQREEER
ncbi:MAG: hypothetical protein KDK04_18590 [Candidatus Competibacteraceae bacterium]|nr:hypothetical protein [Candidatus Competibacteraceae bacterium]